MANTEKERLNGNKEMLHRKMMRSWQEEFDLANRRSKCPHRLVMMGADKKRGICYSCGATI